MKIRTINDLQDYVDSEMSWRKKELTALKSNVATSRAFAKITALRAGIALLYAHFEGSIKNIATAYLEFISQQHLRYSQLKPNFLAISIKENLKQFSETKKTTLQLNIINMINDFQNKTSIIPTENVIKTNSNLNSEIFKEICTTIAIDYSTYEKDFVLLDNVLLKMRNEIAHGDRIESLSLDEERFNEIYEKITNMIISFSIDVMNAACLEKYKSL